MKNQFIILCLLTLLGGCSKNSYDKPWQTLTHQVSTRIAQSVAPHQLESLDQTSLLQDGLTVEQAIGTALKHNRALQTKFEELGIAERDLDAAGLFRNPSIDTIFRFPPSKEEHANIELHATIPIADLWIVPQKKKVAEHVLEGTTLDILTTILATYRDVKQAYFTCYYEQKILAMMSEIYSAMEELVELTEFRHQFGYSTEYDIAYVKVAMLRWQQNLINQEKKVAQRFISLSYTLGLEDYLSPGDTHLEYRANALPLITAKNIDVIKNHALAHNPAILFGRNKILQEKSSVALEKRKVWQNVHIGLSYEREKDKSHGIGPTFGVELPLFNSNRIAIKRAQTVLLHSTKQLAALKQNITSMIYKTVYELGALEQAISISENQILPLSGQAIRYAQRHAETMELDLPTLVSSLISFYEEKQSLINKTLQYYLTIAELEVLIGSQLHTLKI